jgi:drug/metabolite transporter (DMT)-like permease
MQQLHCTLQLAHILQESAAHEPRHQNCLAADAYLRIAVGLHGDIGQVDHAVCHTAGVVAHVAGESGVAVVSAGLENLTHHAEQPLRSLSRHWLRCGAALAVFLRRGEACQCLGAATTMALATVLLALFEPWIMSHRIKRSEVLLGVAIIPGVALVVGGTPAYMHGGLLLGVLSAVFVAIFGALNKRFVGDTDAVTMTFLEMAGGWLFITLLLPWLHSDASAVDVPHGRNVVLLLIMCLACTLLPFVMALKALRHLSAFGTQLAVNLEPVYVIILGIVLLGEQRELQISFYVGVAIILASIFIYPLFHREQAIAPAPID